MIADVEEEKVKATSWSEEKREDDRRESPREGREGFARSTAESL